MRLEWKQLLMLAAAGAAFAALAPMARAQSQNQDAPKTQAQTAQPAPDPLADAARKAKAEKSKTAPKKVYTDDDLSSMHGGGVSVVGEKDSSAAEGDGASGKSGDASGKTAHDEAWWRDRAKKLHDQMAQVDGEIAKLQDEEKKGGGSGFNVQSGLTSNTVYFEDRNAKLKNLQQKKAEIQKQMDALEDEARRADVPVSWVR